MVMERCVRAITHTGVCYMVCDSSLSWITQHSHWLCETGVSSCFFNNWEQLIDLECHACASCHMVTMSTSLPLSASVHGCIIRAGCGAAAQPCFFFCPSGHLWYCREKFPLAKYSILPTEHHCQSDVGETADWTPPATNMVNNHSLCYMFYYICAWVLEYLSIYLTCTKWGCN